MMFRPVFYRPWSCNRCAIVRNLLTLEQKLKLLRNFNLSSTYLGHAIFDRGLVTIDHEQHLSQLISHTVIFTLPGIGVMLIKDTKTEVFAIAIPLATHITYLFIFV